MESQHILNSTHVIFTRQIPTPSTYTVNFLLPQYSNALIHEFKRQLLIRHRPLQTPHSMINMLLNITPPLDLYNNMTLISPQALISHSLKPIPQPHNLLINNNTILVLRRRSLPK
ncbi:uncharacterized protein N7506_003025 [Penicillium brevicompactum]|uniref:uncharacterized protein n=1 Tax=Penicillium brevicompactum TaxID=5074 RepID=UPI002540E4C9|nr:uncharacterized protein N7506_003025 [Penicillium brevicompactum]KAJ5343201.1 hypothetical protein N7506_003025 [Penicillium brevicompactum]